jgi:hypothetical protein
MVVLVVCLGLLSLPLLMILAIYEGYVDSGERDKNQMLKRSKRRVRAMERRKRKGKRTPIELEADIQYLERVTGLR